MKGVRHLCALDANINQPLTFTRCIIFQNKSFSTSSTCLGFLSCVDPHVDFQVSISTETFSTLWAGERLLSGVTSDVVIERAFI